MGKFTYKAPDENTYLGKLKEYLISHEEHEIAPTLYNSLCKIQNSDRYSITKWKDMWTEMSSSLPPPYKKKWNAMWTEILFKIPPRQINEVTDGIREKLIKYCYEIMPKEIGFDVCDVKFNLRSDLEHEINTREDLNKTKTISFISEEKLSKVLNPDLIQKGKFMSEVYLYLYYIENIMRVFINKKLFETYGENFSDNLSRDLKEKITKRKKDEGKNKWLSFRGSSDVFYLDFKDLSSIIKNDWKLFEKYFPNQEWITPKIEELSNIRNLIAHNNYIGEKEINLMKSYYEVILEQIEKNNN